MQVQVKDGIYTPLYSKGNNIRERVARFWIDEHAVTNQDYLEFVNSKPQWQKENIRAIFADKNYLLHWQGVKKLSSKKQWQKIKNSPVVYVSWFAARNYCRWKKKRLPKVKEWEYVASYGRKGQNPKEIKAEILEWYSKVTTKVLPPVKSTWKNNLGIWDMHGLVWEWTEDFNTALITGESRGDSEIDRNLFCGGGATNASDFLNYASFMRYAFRSSLKARYTVANLGFRCAKN